jgi:dTDP-4-dehydrorhamnose reductase
MRVLVLGGNGMLGHKLAQRCRDHFDLWTTIRSASIGLQSKGLLLSESTIPGIDAHDFDSIIRACACVKPDVVINCIGIIKQLPAAKDSIPSISINALFPHRLAALCTACGIRLIHISTDCVFSGRKGMYTENDMPDAEDLYGRSKLLGEVTGEKCLTIRTSIIGHELNTSAGLLEWFLKNKGAAVRGYTNAIFSGFTTPALADIIIDIIKRHQNLSGLYHVSSELINKYDLLALIRDAYGVTVDIQPWPEVCIDRSLDSSRFRSETGFFPDTWLRMITDMATDRRINE